MAPRPRGNGGRPRRREPLVAHPRSPPHLPARARPSANPMERFIIHESARGTKGKGPKNKRPAGEPLRPPTGHPWPTDRRPRSASPSPLQSFFYTEAGEGVKPLSPDRPQRGGTACRLPGGEPSRQRCAGGAPRRSSAAGRRGGRGSALAGQDEAEAAPALPALGPDPPAVLLQDHAGDVEPQAAAWELRAPAVEAVEDVG